MGLGVLRTPSQQVRLLKTANSAPSFQLKQLQRAATVQCSFPWQIGPGGKGRSDSSECAFANSLKLNMQYTQAHH